MNLKANISKLKFRMSIYAKILINFLSLIFLISALLIGLQYYSNNKLAQNAISNDFHTASTNVVEFIETSEKSTKQTLHLLSLNPEFRLSFKEDKKNLILETFVETMKFMSNIKSIYVGYSDNKFYEVINIKNNLLTKIKCTIPKGSVWSVIEIINKKETVKFLDKDLRILSVKTSCV